jgi:hypothetical protein
MKLYWPMAIIKRGKEWDIQHTYDAAMSYEKAMDAIKIWRDEYKFEIISFWIDVTDNGKKIERSTPYVYLDLVKELWADFGDVPMDPETECIEDFWGKFCPGTHREEIWHWFEETFHVSVAKDLM